MKERERIEQAIAALEAQRPVLGDAAVEAALASLRAELAALDESLAEPDGGEAHGATSLTGERRVVTILFCDVKDSTAMAEQLDPEEWAGIIQRALSYLTGPVRQHNGTVAQMTGDGILAFFGAPVAHEEDPQTAVLAGLEIQEGIQEYRDQLKRARGLDFAVRVGIHTGLVVVAGMGTEEQLEYTAIGDTVNLAARMEQTAQPGTVQISEQTYRLVAQIFECEPLGEQKVKGKHEPVRAYRVLGLKAEPAPSRGLERQGLHSPLVGREADLAALQDSLTRLLAGEGGTLSILGEAGVGKSRLIAEIRREAPADRLTWLEGNTLSFGQTIPYWPFQEILRYYADITNQDGEDQAWRKLAQKITELFPERGEGTAPTATEILPYLASLLGLKVIEPYLERVKYLDGEALGRQIFLATRRFFERLAGDKPVVLIFEDLHWMDESSVELLKHLLPLVEQVPILVVGLSRPEPHTPAVYLSGVIAKDHAARYTEVRLAPLSQRYSKQLVRNLLEVEDLPGQVRQLIVEKAEGNPFFLEEILRSLIDLEVLQYDSSSGSWRAAESIEDLAIPDTVQGVILARLDRLTEGVKGVLRVAAVIGRSFLYRVLRDVENAGGQLDAHLTELQHIDIIREKQRLPELEYLFKHALAQEAVYESILLQKRRDLHKKVGQVIERLFADRLEEFYGVLAHHYAIAEAWEPAQAYLLKAADQAGRIAADVEALSHYQQAKAAYGRAFGERWDPVERATLERKMGEAFYRRGELSESLAYLRRSLTQLGNPLPKTRWTIRSAILREILQQAGRSLLPGLFPSRGASRAAEEELHVYQTLISILPSGDHELFLLVTIRMLNISEQNSLPVGIALGSAGLGIVFGFLSLHRLSERYNLQAVRLAEQFQDSDALGLAYMGRLQTSFFRSDPVDWEKGFEYGQRAAEIFQETGNLGSYSVAISINAVLRSWRGDFAYILAKGQELTQLGRDSGDQLIWGGGLWLQAVAKTRIGPLEEAIAHLKQASEVAEASGNKYVTALTRNQLGEWYLHQGQWQPALDALEANNHSLIKHNMSRDENLTNVLYNKLAWAYLMAAEQSDPLEKSAWLKKARRACRTALKLGKSFRSAAAEAMRWQGRYEWLRGNAAGARRWWQESLANAERLGMPYELGMTHLEIARHLDEDASQQLAHMEEAEAIFARIGAELDLAKTREIIKEL